eukprot:187348_1
MLVHPTRLVPVVNQVAGDLALSDPVGDLPLGAEEVVDSPDEPGPVVELAVAEGLGGQEDDGRADDEATQGEQRHTGISLTVEHGVGQPPLPGALGQHDRVAVGDEGGLVGNTVPLDTSEVHGEDTGEGEGLGGGKGSGAAAEHILFFFTLSIKYRNC